MSKIKLLYKEGFIMSFFEKIIIILLLIILITVNVFIFVVINNNFIDNKNKNSFLKQELEDKNKSVKSVVKDVFEGEYEVYQNDRLIKTFFNYDDALNYAGKYENAAVKRIGGSWLWDNTPAYNVYKQNSDDFKAFSNFSDALSYADEIGGCDIYYRKSKSFIWNNHEPVKASYIIKNVPLISQNPELNRGCEVTSLAMLLNYKSIKADKMILAQNIAKDNSEYRIENGEICYGNPNVGFVGDIYNKKNKGLGVYHGPIYELLSNYIGDQALDITGCRGEDILFYISKNRPVWIITNSKFKPLDSSDFEKWKTEEGYIYITYSEHSVLVTGYDENYIYYNDPLDNSSVKKRERDLFIKAWEQMGRQAVTYCP